jgi:hypothetical protein
MTRLMMEKEKGVYECMRYLSEVTPRFLTDTAPTPRRHRADIAPTSHHAVANANAKASASA